MIIKEITVNNYGPFAKPTLIKFEPGVTIFTGKNDTGKTSVLRLLNMIWTTGIITEDEANIDRTIISNVAWTKDTEVGCKMQIQGTALSKKYFEFPEAKEDSIIDVSFRFSPESPYKMIDGVTTTQKRININRKFLKSPSILFNSSDSVQINPVINLENPNEIEEKLLLLAFGRNPYDKLINISTWKLDNILENGSLQLNTALRRIIPKGLKYEIKFHKSVGVDFLD